MRVCGRVCKGGFMVHRIGVMLFIGLLSGCLMGATALGLGRAQAGSQKSFPTAEKAAEALAAGYKCADQGSLLEILGPKGHRLVSSGDPVADQVEREWFISLYDEGHSVFFESEDRAVIQIGNDEQPYPVPIVKNREKWRFDSSEGHEDLLSRRISKNELSALNLAITYVEAQKEYYRIDHDGDGLLEYAQLLRSNEGNHDGLYWKKEAEGDGSPAEPFAEVACKEGYSLNHRGSAPYRGYYYKVLKGQGPNAPGGEMDYVLNGKMVGGFALVAYPARYNISGVMTFMVNQNGVVYQKDLGPRTVSIAQKMATFNPDKTWTRGQQ